MKTINRDTNKWNGGGRGKSFLAILLSCALASSAFPQAIITVDVDKPGHAVSPTLWGIFFEDINLSADGGLYPELVRNRSFEDSAEPQFWKLSNDAGGRTSMKVDATQPLNALNPHSLRVSVEGGFAIENTGYWGMNIAKGEEYVFKVAAFALDDAIGPLKIKILSSGSNQLAGGEIPALTGKWKYYTLDFTSTDSDPKAMLQISGSGKGTLFLDMVSLLPKRTWKNHGLRVDLAEALDALHPSFMRFPGGNWVEGDDIAHMYHWKQTIGEPDARIPLWNTWGYNTTHGLGFHEYLQLCEDLNAEPLFCINDGMSLHDSVPLGDMGQWVQDALDAIEYATGPTNTIWGGKRALNGHPAPFNLRYMEIGNENGGPDYHQRWAMLANAIREKYPVVQLIVNTDLRGRPYPRIPAPDIVDEHYYESPESFMTRAGQYDGYDRTGPKIFIGEYAVTQKAGKGNLRAAIGEAAFMTGMERNSDVVVMASYAPLFVNLNHRAWNPDLINYNGSRWYGLPGYYVQKMFSENRGGVTVPVSVTSGEVEEKPPMGEIGVGTWNTEAEFKDIKVTAPDGTILFASDFSHPSDDWKFLGGGDWQVRDGALRQNIQKDFVRALAGGKAWKDYTLELKARKITGREGFLVLFHINNDEDRTWWNIGGWNNTQDALELEQTTDAKPGSVKTGHWYDLRIDVRGTSIKCWLDGQLVHNLDQRLHSTHRLYASTTRDSKSGDIILKVVNTANTPVSTDINLRGAARLSGPGQAIILTSGNPLDENSLDQPDKVSPRTEALQFQGGQSASIQRTFDPNSFTILRIPVK